MSRAQWHKKWCFSFCVWMVSLCFSQLCAIFNYHAFVHTTQMAMSLFVLWTPLCISLNNFPHNHHTLLPQFGLKWRFFFFFFFFYLPFSTVHYSPNCVLFFLRHLFICVRQHWRPEINIFIDFLIFNWC